jgi:DNA-binding Lrp family transcriptional regulator
MTNNIGIPTLDATDQRLLALLRADARSPTAELARHLGLSRTTVQSRIERLRRRGIVAGFTVRAGEAHERGQIQAQVMITTLPKLSARVEAALQRVPEVRRLYAISGVHDLIAVVVADSVGAMNAVLDRIGALEGVDRTVSSIILSTRIDR